MKQFLRSTSTLLIAFTALLALAFSQQSAAQEATAAAAAAAQHGIPWHTLQALDGKYPSDKPATTVLKPALKKLLKAKYKEFSTYYLVQTPMKIDNGILLSSGMMPHSGGDFAAFALFGSKGELLVVIKREHQLEYIGNQQLLGNPVVPPYLKTFQ